MQEVFLDCFKSNGALDRADKTRAGGFRAFFYGAARTAALRCEQAYHLNTKRSPSVDIDADRVGADERSLSEVFDRAWAQSVVREAVAVHRAQARMFDGREKMRVEILRLRFEVGKPIREIAKLLDLTPELAHQEYAAARKGFRHVLEDVVAAHYADSELSITERCREVLLLLG